MVFASISFLYWFLPVVLLVHFILPKAWRNGWLLVASLFFYGWGEPKSLLLLAGSILIGYGAGLGIEKCHGKLRHFLLWGAIVVEAGFLIYFKYADFFIENINRMTGLTIPILRVLLPVGISFYTFQMISYLVDIYRENVQAQRNLVNFAMYICLFTQLVAGPIVRYTEMAGQLNDRVITTEDVKTGIRRVIFGLSKKVLLADTLGEFCETVKGFQEPTVLALWLAAVAFAMQIYFDFSGYSDMAIGLGRILGFRFPENFHYPYAAASITEFWRRWHISLTQWFRDYLYIPLGGNRCSRWKWICNVLVVWLFTGFWHGAEWNYILWGLYFAVLLILEKMFCVSATRTDMNAEMKSDIEAKINAETKTRIETTTGMATITGVEPISCGKAEKITDELWKKKPWKCLGSHIYVVLVVVIGFVIFEETDLLQLGQRLSGMFGLTGMAIHSQETRYYMHSYGVVILLGILGSIPIGKHLVMKVKESAIGKKVLVVMEPIVWVLLLIMSTAYLIDGSYHPFLYFRF